MTSNSTPTNSPFDMVYNHIVGDQTNIVINQSLQLTGQSLFSLEGGSIPEARIQLTDVSYRLAEIIISVLRRYLEAGLDVDDLRTEIQSQTNRAVSLHNQLSHEESDSSAASIRSSVKTTSSSSYSFDSQDSDKVLLTSLRELRYGPLSVPSASVHKLSQIFRDFPLLEVDSIGISQAQHVPLSIADPASAGQKERKADKIRRLNAVRKLVLSVQHLLFQRDPLQAAAAAGDLTRVKLLLEIGANVNATTKIYPRMTALSAAASEGHFDVARFLVENGADVHSCSPCGCALTGSHLAIAELLVKNGAQVDSRSGNGSNDNPTALIVAAGMGDGHFVELLIQKGADVNIRVNQSPRSALEAAAQGRHFSIIKVLLDNGARGDDEKFLEMFFGSDQSTDDSNSSLDEHYTASIKLLLSEANLKEQSFCASALLAASTAGCLSILKLLFDNNIDVNLEDEHGDNALHRASREGHISVVQLLLDKDADVNAFNYAPNASGLYQYRTALHSALDGDHLDIIKLLLEKGANANAEDKASGTEAPLLRALKDGRFSVVETLLAHGADPNSVDAKHSPALLLAWEGGHINVAKRLVESGANINDHKLGSDPLLHRALKSGDTSMFELLLEKGADVGAQDADKLTALHVALVGGDISIVKLLLEKGADVNARDVSNSTLLHRASEEGHIAMVQLLCEKGADINALDSKSETALHRASRNGHTDVVKELLDRKANPSAEDINSGTPLHGASQRGHLSIAKLLIASGANVNAMELDRTLYNRYAPRKLTPLQMAAAGGYFSLVRLLLDNGADLTLGTETPLAAARRQNKQAIVQLLSSKGAIR